MRFWIGRYGMLDRRCSGYGLDILIDMLQQEKHFVTKVMPIFVTSFIFQLLQFLFAMGASDITDLIPNTLSGVIGFGIFFILSKILKQKVLAIVNVISLIIAISLIALIGILSLANIYKFSPVLVSRPFRILPIHIANKTEITSLAK